MKVFLLIQSGYSARNFILSGFTDHPDFKFSIWSDQQYIKNYDIENQFVSLPKYDYHTKINFLQRVKNRSEIYFNVKRTKNSNYLSYLGGINPSKKIRVRLRNLLIHWIAKLYASEKGIQKLDIPFHKAVRKTSYYLSCKKQLLEEKPSIVFCTHQRASVAVAPMLAARDLGIRTICFVHSWDNIPKGVQLVKADSYFVWSDYMKNEMLLHYPFINEKDILVTGTPQFSIYFKDKFRLERSTFLKEFNLDTEKKYILFTGNDRTSSPNDPYYLSHICESLKKINEQNNDAYRILFRPNPIDRNDNFNDILKEHSDIVIELKPEWFGAKNFFWNKGGPSEKDITLLMNSILHTEIVINVGSTVAIDAAILGKTTCWINFEIPNKYKWSVRKAYNYIHFKIIEGFEPVFWIQNQNDIQGVLEEALKNPEKKQKDRDKWVEKVVKTPINLTNERMWNFLNESHEI